MFNFSTIKLDKRTNDDRDSFVGIRKTDQGEIIFRLPIGFENFPDGNFNATKQLFFRMYRTFKKFENDNLKSFHDTKPKGRDNIEVGGNAYQFKDKDGNDILLYSKINIIENMLDVYRDLALNSIERRIGRNEDVDFSKIDLYLHKAVYLHHNATDDVNIYIDEMDLPRHTLQYESASIIELFCFIISELKQELEQTVDVRINELSNKFKEQFLTHNQSLFNEETFEITILSLKEILDDIDKNTIYKDDDYWQLYEAIDIFLYGELDMKNTHKEGVFWGISNFWRIWEDMCHTYAFKNYNDIFYADTNIIIDDKHVANCAFGGHKIFCKEDNFENPFFIAFRGYKRWMRPDLIRITENDLFTNFIDIDIISESEFYGIPMLTFSLKLKPNIVQSDEIYEDAKNARRGLIKYLKQKLRNSAIFRDNKFINYKKIDLEHDKARFIKKDSLFLIGNTIIKLHAHNTMKK